MDFLTCKYIGRMGNQMHQIATTVALALRNDVEYVFRTRYDGGHPIYFPDLPALTDHIEGDILEERHEFHEIKYKPNHQLVGYWQSEKYYKDFRKEILDLFNWPHEMIKGVVSIHVRRGDFVLHQESFPLCTMEYYDKAIGIFREMGYDKFLLFSDDIDWCRDNFHQDIDLSFSEGLRGIENCKRMSQCEHNIVANSTYSTWGAWMNRNPDKVVVAPSEYNQFGKNISLNTKDIVPENWIQIRF